MGLWKDRKPTEPKEREAKGIEKGKARANRANYADDALMKKAAEAGRPGKPKLTRKEIKILQEKDKNAH